MSGPDPDKPVSLDKAANAPGPVSPGGPGGAGSPAAPQGATLAGRLTTYLRGGGIITPLLTTLVAFLVGGLALLATGRNPIDAYQGIYDGSGLAWLLPWSDDREFSAINLQLTLLRATPLILVGFAVAFAFRAGLFNIGGQGQYTVGTIVAVWVGSSFSGMAGWLHVLLAIALAALAGAAWAGIAGLLRATVGANEVISTIMLNYIALWIGVYLFSLDGPLHDDAQAGVPSSEPIAEAVKLPVFWGDAALQGLHIGLFIALAAGLVFWIVLNRSVRGYEARAVGLSPSAASYAGIDVGRTYIRVMATCGAFAGLAGAMDILGFQFVLVTNDIQTSQIGFLGIAVALLGRNTALGTVIAAVLFGALLQGTSVRNLDATLDPNLAGNLTTIIQGLVVLFVAADVLVVYLFTKARRGGRGRKGRGRPTGRGKRKRRAATYVPASPGASA